MTIPAAPLRTYNSPRLLARQEGILAAARDELAEKGFQGVTMNRLAERAGVTKKTLYNIFQSKESLLLAAISEVIGIYRDVPLDSEAGLPAILSSRRAAIAQVTAAPDYACAMLTALVQEEEGGRLTQLLLDDSVASLAHHLEIEKTKAGLGADTDAKTLALQLAGQAWGQVLLFHRRVIDLDQFSNGSIEGLLMLLMANAEGRTKSWLENEQGTFAAKKIA